MKANRNERINLMTTEKKKPDMVITFHFVSGKKIHVNYYQEDFDKLLELLERDWDKVQAIGPDFGLNYSLVTHYEVTRRR